MSEGAATTDIFADPFVEKTLPEKHEMISDEVKKNIDKQRERIQAVKENTESIENFYKRIFKYFYAKWKTPEALPDPLDIDSQITEEELKEIQNYNLDQKKSNPESSMNSIKDTFLKTIFKTEDLNEEFKKIEAQNQELVKIQFKNGKEEKIPSGKSSVGIGGQIIRTYPMLMESIKSFGLQEEISYNRASAPPAIMNIGKKNETTPSTDEIHGDNLIFLSYTSYFQPIKQQRERFESSSKILFQEETPVGNVMKLFNEITLPATYLIEKEYIIEAWKKNGIRFFTKNIGDYMRSFEDSLELWNTSKWITVVNSSYIPKLSLWKERFIVIDKKLPEEHEYINFQDIEDYLSKDDTIKEEEFQQIKDEILALQRLLSKKDKKNPEIKQQREKINSILGPTKRQVYSYNLLADNTILLMDPETMFWIYTKAPQLWEYKQYEKDIPEQNLKMIFLLQYIRILADFQKKGKQGIQLLKDNLQSIPIEEEIKKLVENDEIWQRILEKQVDLYPALNIPIQTKEDLYSFLADIRKPLALKEINIEKELGIQNQEENNESVISNISIEMPENENENNGSVISNISTNETPKGGRRKKQRTTRKKNRS